MVIQDPLIPLRHRISSALERLEQPRRLAKEFVSLLALLLVSTGQNPNPDPDMLIPAWKYFVTLFAIKCK